MPQLVSQIKGGGGGSGQDSCCIVTKSENNVSLLKFSCTPSCNSKSGGEGEGRSWTGEGKLEEKMEQKMED